MAKEKTEAQMKMDDAAAGAVKELAPIIKNGSAVDLVISTGTPGGTYIQLGAQLARILEEYRGVQIGAVEARASAGSVYPTLQQLEDEGLLTSETANGRRVYRATEPGRREIEDEDSAVRSIWRRAERWGDWGFAFHPEALEIARPAQRLMKTAFRAISRDGADPDRVCEILDRARREIRRLDERQREED